MFLTDEAVLPHHREYLTSVIGGVSILDEEEPDAILEGGLKGDVDEVLRYLIGHRGNALDLLAVESRPELKLGQKPSDIIKALVANARDVLPRASCKKLNQRISDRGRQSSTDIVPAPESAVGGMRLTCLREKPRSPRTH